MSTKLTLDQMAQRLASNKHLDLAHAGVMMLDPDIANPYVIAVLDALYSQTVELTVVLRTLVEQQGGQA